MQFRARSFFLFLILSVTLLAGCTRKEDASSHLSISIPHTMTSSKLGAQSGETLTNVIINITGPNMQPILAQWESCSDCLVPSAIPSELKIMEVPTGPDRLIQVLAVYKDTANVMSIYYGDVQKAVDSNPDVPITVSQLPMTDALPTINGNITGRYLKDDGTGPTGQIHTIFNPGAGKQPMVIEKSAIVAGWFRVFGLDNIQFDYQIVETSGGKYPLFSSSTVNLNSSDFNPSNTVVKAFLPVRQRQQNGTTWRDEDAEIDVWGWFGSAAQVATKKIKNLETASPQAFSRYRVYASAASLMATNASAPTKAELQNEVSPLTVASFLGGVASAAGSTLIDYIPVSRNLVENGGDSIGGFQAPFNFVTPNNLFTIITTPSYKTISGKVLPGVPSVIDSFRAYKKSGAGTSYSLNRVNCLQAANGSDSFTRADLGEGIVNAGLDFKIDISMTTAEASAGTPVILCGVKNGVVYESGTLLYPYMFMMGGGSGTPGGPPVKLSLALVNGNSGTVTTSHSVCQPLGMQVLDASGLPATLTNSLDFNLSGANFYYDQYCQNSIANPFRVQYPKQVIFTKLNPGAGTITTVLTNPPGTWTDGTLVVSGTTPASPASVKLVSDGDLSSITSLISYSCLPSLAVVVDSNGYPVTNGYAMASFSVLNQSGSQAVSTYLSGDCSGSAAPNIPYYQSSYDTSTTRFAIAYTPKTDRSDTSASLLGNFASGSVGSLTSNAVSITHPGPPAQIRVRATNLAGDYYSDAPLGVCVPVKFNLVDSNYNRLPFTGSGTLAFTRTLSSGSVNDVQLYPGPDCISGGTSNLNVGVSNGALEAVAYMKGAGSVNSDTFQLFADFNGFGGTGPQAGVGGYVQPTFVIDPVKSSPNGGNVFVASTPECVSLDVRMQVNGKNYFPGTDTAMNIGHTGSGSYTIYDTAGCSGSPSVAISAATGVGKVYYMNSTAGLKSFSVTDPYSVITPSSSVSISLGLQAILSATTPMKTNLSAGVDCLSGLQVSFKDYFGAYYTGSLNSITSPTFSITPTGGVWDDDTTCATGIATSTANGIFPMAIKYISSTYPSSTSLSFSGISVPGIMIAPSGSVMTPP